MLYLRGFILKLSERKLALMFNRLTYFYVTSTITSVYFKYFNFEKKKKNWETKSFLQESTILFFIWNYKNWTRNISIQIEWNRQNGPTTKNGFLPVITFFFWKFYSSIIFFAKSWFYVPLRKYPYSYVSEVLDFYLRMLFPCKNPLKFLRGTTKESEN